MIQRSHEPTANKSQLGETYVRILMHDMAGKNNIPILHEDHAGS